MTESLTDHDPAGATVPRCTGPLRRRAVFSTVLGLVLLGTPLASATKVAVVEGGPCRVSSVGVVRADAVGRKLICTTVTKTAARWRLPAIGSPLRPIPLGRTADAGPVTGRFRLQVTEVNTNAYDEIKATSPYVARPAPAVSYVRVEVKATFLGPEALGSIGHVWYALDQTGRQYAASDGCGGGYGGDFDIGTGVAKGQVQSGHHCFEVPETSVASLVLRVEGWGGNRDIHFALR